MMFWSAGHVQPTELHQPGCPQGLLRAQTELLWASPHSRLQGKSGLTEDVLPGDWGGAQEGEHPLEWVGGSRGRSTGWQPGKEWGRSALWQRPGKVARLSGTAEGLDSRLQDCQPEWIPRPLPSI